MDRQSPYFLKRAWVRWTLYLAFMTLLGLINTGQSYVYFLTEGTTSSFRFWPTLILGLSDWYLWFALTPAIIWLSQRYPFHLNNWLKSLVAHLGCNLVFSFFVSSATVRVFLWVSPFAHEPTFSFWQWFHRRIDIYMILYFWLYWAILGTLLSAQYYRQFRDRELKASRLETQLALAQLQ